MYFPFMPSRIEGAARGSGATGHAVILLPHTLNLELRDEVVWLAIEPMPYVISYGDKRIVHARVKI